MVLEKKNRVCLYCSNNTKRFTLRGLKMHTSKMHQEKLDRFERDGYKGMKCLPRFQRKRRVERENEKKEEGRRMEKNKEMLL